MGPRDRPPSAGGRAPCKAALLQRRCQGICLARAHLVMAQAAVFARLLVQTAAPAAAGMAPVHVGQSCGADDDADSCQWTGRFAFLSALALHRWRPDWRANCLCFLRLNTGTRRAPLTLPCSQLPSIGVAQEFISFKNTTMESEKYVCIRETGATNQVVIVDMASPLSPSRRQITADSALMLSLLHISAPTRLRRI